MWEVKQNLRFLFTRHRILPSCGCKAREIVVAKCELVLQGTSLVEYIRFLLPFKPYLAEKISLQRCNCNIFGLTATAEALFGNEARFFRFKVFFPACYLQNEVGDPSLFFYISDITNSSSFNGKILRKNQCKKIFARTSLRSPSPIMAPDTIYYNVIYASVFTSGS